MAVFSFPNIGDVAAGDAPPPPAPPPVIEPEPPPPAGDAPPFDPIGLTGANEIAQAAFAAVLVQQQLTAAANMVAGAGGGGGGAAEAIAIGTGVSGVGLLSLIGIPFNVTDTGLIDTDFTVTHNLGFVPLFWVEVRPAAAHIIYNGSVAASVTTLTLRCNVANQNVWILIVGMGI